VASLRHELRIAASADAVWDIIKDPQSIPDWFPGVESCLVEGTTRILRTKNGMEIPEKILAIDPKLRRFAYRITAPLYTFHLGTIDVIALGVNDTLCVYSTTAEPDALALIIAGATVEALAEIKRKAEMSN
jgi:hypothetical protein